MLSRFQHLFIRLLRRLWDFVPLIAGFTGGLEHINAYRIIMPHSVSAVHLSDFSAISAQKSVLSFKDYTESAVL